MSQAPTSDPRLEHCVQREGTYPRPPRETTTTPVEWLLIASQARNQQLAFLEPVEELGERIAEEMTSKPPEPSMGPPEPAETQVPSPTTQISSRELQVILAVLAKQSNNWSQKKLHMIKEPDPFSREGPEELWAFVFQYQIYFRACKKEFSDNADKIFFAISYLWGIALDYIEPFINEPDPYHNLDFLEDWPAFVQKLSNIFSSYSPKDNDKDAIVSILFPSDGKTIDYFICFAKYQNCICWDERALHKVVKDAIPNHVRDELCYSQEDMSLFEGFKRAVLHIDNNYWERIQDDKNKSWTNRLP